jgi:hypothetical protein
MKNWQFGLAMLALSAAILGVPAVAAGQGVTTAAVTGQVTDIPGDPLANVTVTAVHEPSGSRYGGVTRADGRFTIPGMRVGGPYTITASRIGYESQTQEQVTLNLGVATDVRFTLRETAVALEGVTVVGTRDAIFSSDRTGAATSVPREGIEALPSISRRIEDYARLTPQFGGNFSFAGQDGRLNNITVDGAYFNNSFGLGGQPGDRTGVAPISMDAIEQVQVNIAPFDVRQGNFVGAGINTVTRSGTNQFRGSLRYDMRDQGLVGTQAGSSEFDPGEFQFHNIGGWISGPIIRNRLFFFLNYERENETAPATTFRANRGDPVGGTITRVRAEDLDQLSAFLRDNFGYETGRYEGYDHNTPASRFLGRLDFNLDDRNRFSLRYSHLDSETDVLASNSSSLGFGSRRTNLTALNFENTNYAILENRRSVAAEWNAQFGQNFANQLIVGYDFSDESRGTPGEFFPLVDILDGGSVYTSFGREPFTPNNELRYRSLQIQNNFTRFGTSHTQTFGASAEFYRSENVFFPGSQSAYVYNSLEDFYADANDYLANPNRTTSPVDVRRFQVRWMNQPGMDKPLQPLEVFYAGLYGQNEWRASQDLTVTLGARVDVPFFAATGFRNAAADALTFRDEDGNPVQYRTDKLPDANPLFSPRLGFNWDARGDQRTQVRGGSGVFTGQPAYVWISNQIGNTGVLTGFERLDDTDQRPFHPDPNHYKPSNVTGEPASSYELALTDPGFRFPQQWRTNVAVDQRLPFNFIGTLEFIYGRDVNGIYYINANLAEPDTRFIGVDDRPRWTAGNRIHGNVDNAVVLKNQHIGRNWIAAGSIERPFGDGYFVKAAYSYGEAKNTIDSGSIAFGSWNNNPHDGDPNNPPLAFSTNSPGHRFFAVASARRDWFRFGGTSASLFIEGRTTGNGSYRFQGDTNGDGGTNNDLIYIPRDRSEMNFQEYSSDGVTFTREQQEAAWEAFIQQDPYLSANRGRYAERNAAFLPMTWRADLSFAQQLFTDIGSSRNGVELRADVINFTNLLNSDWGQGHAFVSEQPLIARGADDDGRVQYRLRNLGGELITESFRRTAGPADVWRVQLGLRYTFN